MRAGSCGKAVAEGKTATCADCEHFCFGVLSLCEWSCLVLCMYAEGASWTWQRGRAACLRRTKQQCGVF